VPRKKRIFFDLKKIWEQVPPDYYANGIKKNFLQRFWHKNKLKLIISLIGIDKKIKILDLGCAGGFITYGISKNYPEAQVYGLDVYKKAILYARKKYPKIRFFIGDGHKLPFSNGSFDLIVCSETLEHVTNPKQVLKEMQRCLSKKGQIIVTMDSGNILFSIAWFFWVRMKGKVWRNSHLHKFNVKVLESLILESGFKIKSSERFNLSMAIAFLAEPI